MRVLRIFIILFVRKKYILLLLLIEKKWMLVKINREVIKNFINVVLYIVVLFLSIDKKNIFN